MIVPSENSQLNKFNIYILLFIIGVIGSEITRDLPARDGRSSSNLERYYRSREQGLFVYAFISYLLFKISIACFPYNLKNGYIVQVLRETKAHLESQLHISRQEINSLTAKLETLREAQFSIQTAKESDIALLKADCKLNSYNLTATSANYEEKCIQLREVHFYILVYYKRPIIFLLLLIQLCR